MSMAACSLILATVGRTSELERLFNSLAVQTFHDFEVIVVDQNTDDRLTPHLVRAVSLGLVIRHLKHHPPNLAAARNAGIEAATGEWIGFPDDDCWYDRAALKILEMRFTGIEAPTGVIVRWMEQSDPLVAAANLTWARSKKFRDIPVSSITLFLRRSLFDRIGGFDSRFGIGQWFGAAEETDMVLRALRSGALIVYEATAQVHHAVITQTPAENPLARLAARHRARGTGALYAKHALPLWVIVRGLAAPVLRPLLKGAFGAELAHGCAVTLGRLDGLLGWNRRRK